MLQRPAVGRPTFASPSVGPASPSASMPALASALSYRRFSRSRTARAPATPWSGRIRTHPSPTTNTLVTDAHGASRPTTDFARNRPPRAAARPTTRSRRAAQTSALFGGRRHRLKGWGKPGGQRPRPPAPARAAGASATDRWRGTLRNRARTWPRARVGNTIGGQRLLRGTISPVSAAHVDSERATAARIGTTRPRTDCASARIELVARTLAPRATVRRDATPRTTPSARASSRRGRRPHGAALAAGRTAGAVPARWVAGPGHRRACTGSARRFARR